MTSALSFIFYVLFALILLGMYLAIRRGWGAPGFVAGVGVVGSIVTMLLMSISQGNAALHAVVVGLLVGVAFSGATLAIAWYFRVRQIRAGAGQSENA